LLILGTLTGLLVSIGALKPPSNKNLTRLLKYMYLFISSNMSKSKILKCIVTGVETMYAGDFLNKKIEEYGSEQLLEKYYVSKEVKSLLKKRYKIKDIFKILNTPTISLSDDIITYLENMYRDIKVANIGETMNISEFTNNNSDKDVETFITKYIIQV